jgi:hypothetical protein
MTRTCPHCGVPLKPGQIRGAGIFPYPNCQAHLQASTRYGQWVGLASFLLAVGASFALGFAGLHLIYAILLLTVIADVLLINLLKYAIPPKITAALPPKAFRQVAREIMGPTVLGLSDTKRSSRRDGPADEDGRV